MSIRSQIYKSRVQKNDTDREIQGLEILSVKVALQTMGVDKPAWRVQGMRRLKGQE